MSGAGNEEIFRWEGKGGEMRRVAGISTIKSKTLLGRIFAMPFFLVNPRLLQEQEE